MPEMPKVEPGDWIRIGERDALVCQLYKERPSPAGSRIEVVYDRKRPTNADVVWADTHWDFVEKGDFGGYADNYPRLAGWVRLLRAGRPR
jgi:hypothetical protein